MITRRNLLAAGVGSLFATVAMKDVMAQATNDRKSAKTQLVLLGTMGGSRITKMRAAPSQVIIANNQLYVIDCGNGVTRQLVFADCDLKNLRSIFITHHHNDHNLDYGNLLFLALNAGLNKKVHAYGPSPLAKMTQSYLEMNDYTERSSAVLGRMPLKDLIQVQEIAKPGLVMEDENVRVTTVSVNHPPVPTFAFRFDTPDRSITISSDTTPWPALIELAKGSDVLVHEVIHKPSLEKLAAKLPQFKNLVEFLSSSHTTTEDAGKVAQQAGVKTLVLTHFVPGDDPTITDAMWAEGPRKFFKGEIIVGKDLLRV